AADLASAYASLELDLPPVPAKGTEDLAGRADTRPAVPGSEAAAAALIDSLPTPRPPVSTRPMPTRTRPPAFGAEAPGPPAAPSAAGPTAAGADDERATRDLTLEPTDPSLPAAPTRELGLRNNDRRAATEDETTGQVDVYRVRAARSNGKPEILGMDPIDARSAEILDQIDGGAPAIETREERTRRRITALL